MGTWGAAILSDDVSADVYADYMEKFDAGEDHADVLKEVQPAYAHEMLDEEDGPAVWLALAQAQWECGALDENVLYKATEIVTSGRDLPRWEEAGKRQARARQEVLQKFLIQMQPPNWKPEIARLRTREGRSKTAETPRATETAQALTNPGSVPTASTESTRTCFGASYPQ